MKMLEKVRCGGCLAWTNRIFGARSLKCPERHHRLLASNPVTVLPLKVGVTLVLVVLTHLEVTGGDTEEGAAETPGYTYYEDIQRHSEPYE